MRYFSIISLVVCFSVLTSSLGIAQKIAKATEFAVHRNVISTYPVFDVFGAFNAGYEHAFSKKVSLSGWVAFYPFNDDPPLVIKSQTLFGIAEGRFFPFGKAPQGFFSGPFLFYNYTWFKAGYTENGASEIIVGYQSAHSNGLAFGITTGYKFIIAKRMAIEFCLHVGKNYLLNEDSYGIAYDEKYLVFPMINLGYAFK